MKCKSDICPEPLKGQRYVVDGVTVCLACGEMERGYKMVSLDDFCRLAPEHQKMVGTFRQTVKEARGHYDYLRDDGVEILRSY